jgi:hypothetical protein
MAKELGIGPRSVVKNVPSPREPWKAPVRQRIRELHERRQRKGEVRAKERVDGGREAKHAARETRTSEGHPTPCELDGGDGDPVPNGRLCDFGTRPKERSECLVPGCGEAPFLRRHAEFVLDPAALAPEKAVPLFDREARLGPPASGRLEPDSHAERHGDGQGERPSPRDEA